MSTQSIGFAVITGRSSGVGAVYGRSPGVPRLRLALSWQNRECMNDPAKKLAAATGLKVEILVANLIDSKELAGLKPILRDDSRAALLVNDAGVGALHHY